MKPLLVIENDARDPLGYLEDAIVARGSEAIIVGASVGDPIPTIDGFAGLIILGGPQGAYEGATYPYLEDEMSLIRDAVAADVPVLGICLGSQLIAHALGGRAYRADQPEVRVLTPQLSDEGGRDPMGAPLAKPVVTFHQDTFDVPPGATVLARSDRFTQAFRCGSALAIQPHPEVSADRVESWLPRTELPQMAGVDGAYVVQAMRNSVDPADASMLFTAWLDQITAPIS